MNSKKIDQKTWRVCFYPSVSGNLPVWDFVDELNPDQRGDFDKHLKLLMEFGVKLGLPHAKDVKGHKPLWELRPDGFRILYFLDSKRQFILLHGFPKKVLKIPARHIDTAMSRLVDYKERFE